MPRLPQLTDVEKTILRFLAERFERGGRYIYVNVPEFPNFKDHGEREFKEILHRLQTHGLLTWHSNESVLATKAAWDAVEQFDRPNAPVSRDARRRLLALRDELAALSAYPWDQIGSWIPKAVPIIRRDWPNDFDDFRDLAATPRWITLPRALGRNESQKKEVLAKLQATEDQANRTSAERAKSRIVSFMDGLLVATAACDSPDQFALLVSAPVRQRVLQAILEVQGESANYVYDKDIAERLGLPLGEVKGHLEILRDESKIKFTSSNAGCSGYMTDGQKQRFNESQMLEQTRQFEIARVVAPVEITDSLDRFRRDHPDPNKVAFIMMRFGSTPAHDAIVEGIRSALSSLGIAGLRADDQQYHDDLWYNVLTYIVGCGFGIAVFERLEQDEFNPNVSLEVGCMYGLNKPVCLLKDKTLRQLHSDLMGKLYRPFDPQDPKGTIPVELSKWLADKGIG